MLHMHMVLPLIVIPMMTFAAMILNWNGLVLYEVLRFIIYKYILGIRGEI
jgi:hypothetical protein